MGVRCAAAARTMRDTSSVLSGNTTACSNQGASRGDAFAASRGRTLSHLVHVPGMRHVYEACRGLCSVCRPPNQSHCIWAQEPSRRGAAAAAAASMHLRSDGAVEALVPPVLLQRRGGGGEAVAHNGLQLRLAEAEGVQQPFEWDRQQRGAAAVSGGGGGGGGGKAPAGRPVALPAIPGSGSGPAGGRGGPAGTPRALGL